MRAPALVFAIIEYLREQTEQEKYRAYLYECIRLSCLNSSAQVPGGKYIDMSYAQIMGYGEKETDTRTAEEIVADVTKKAGLTVRKGGEIIEFV